MPALINPYVAGGPVGGQAGFVGRQESLRQLIGAMHQGDAPVAVVAGLPGSGRTSLLDELASQLMDAQRLVAVRFDLRPLIREPLDTVVSAFASELGASLELTMPELGQWAEAQFVERYLPNVLSNLDPQDRVVIIMDEFPMVWDPRSRQASGAFLPWLAGLMEQHPDRFGAIFTMDLRRTDQDSVLKRYFAAPSRCPLEALDVAGAWALVRQSHLNDSLRWSNEAVERVLQLTGAWPYLTQLVCSAVWTRSRSSAAQGAPPPTVSRQNVDDAVTTALDQGNAWFESLWSGLPPASRIVLSVLAGQNEHVLPRSELAKRLHRAGVLVVTEDLEARGPQELLRQGLMAQRGESILVSIPLLRAWVRRAHRVSKELSQLDHLVPEAKQLFHEASQLWRNAAHQGARQDAKGLLEMALKHNPNHAEAMDLLATIHEEQDDLPAAERLLGQLSVSQPARARPRLVRVLIEQAHRARTTSEKAVFYKRVLDTAPGNVEATRELERMAHEDALIESITGEVPKGGVAPPAPAPVPAPAPASVPTPLPVLEPLHTITRPDLASPLSPAPPVAQADEGWAGNLPRQNALEATYQGAVHAIETGDKDTARIHLQAVIAQRPAYRDAARLLYQVVEGVDPVALQRRVDRSVPRSVFGASVLLTGVLAATWLLGVTPPTASPVPEPNLSALAVTPTPAAPQPPPGADPQADPSTATADPPTEPPEPAAPAAEPEAAPEPPANATGPTANALISQGWRLLDLNRVGEAELAFDRAVRSGGGAGALYGRGYVADQLGQKAVAVKDYCAALDASAPGTEVTREVEGRLRALNLSCR